MRLTLVALAVYCVASSSAFAGEAPRAASDLEREFDETVVALTAKRRAIPVGENAADHYARIDTYARLAAEDLARKGKRAGLLNMYLRPAWRWFTELFLMGAIVDGRLGVVMASRSAYGVYLRYTYLKQALAEKSRRA